ncbi:MAG: bifunctional phosphopantothenoylcysteine decarboxylase/phosphopantothenate--cysteine ligase CoaBC [Tuberibacillus sp.]
MEGKQILLGVTGGIAAYKACTLTSQLTKAGADVHVIMTKEAKRFVTPQTFQALSRNPVHDDVFTEKNEHQIAHIDLADRADLVIIAPATANTIAKMAQGLADDMVTTAVLATQAPVWVAPAMNVNMYHHPAVMKNLAAIQDYGYRILDPGVGLLACGWVGEGRLMEPEDIFKEIQTFFNADQAKDLDGKKVLVTAGPTQERLDPVRYLTNHSSGKMGFAIAEEAKKRGADVMLISGPTELAPPSGIKFIMVESAIEMHKIVKENFGQADAVIMTAAVSDYRPKTVSSRKIKKSDGNLIIEFVRNPDILEELGKTKTDQILIGFAAETNDIDLYAKRKLEKKNLDMVVANDVSKSDIGFRSDNNQVSLYFRDGRIRHLNKMSKSEVAAIICSELANLFEKSGVK